MKQLKQSGEVKSFDLQPSFVLMDKFKHPTQNKTVRAIKYVADFKVEYADGSIKVIDVKGKLLRITSLKIKLFMSKYGIPLVLAKYNYSKKEFTHVEY